MTENNSKSKNEINKNALHEIIAFYRVPATMANPPKKLTSRMRISPETFTETDSGFAFDEKFENDIKSNLIESFKKMSGKIEEDRIEFFLHEFLEFAEDDEITGERRAEQYTVYNFPIFIRRPPQ